jgi:hypothetical protein
VGTRKAQPIPREARAWDRDARATPLRLKAATHHLPAVRRCRSEPAYGVAGVHALFVQTLPVAHWVQAAPAPQFAPVVLLSGAQVAVAPVPHRWKPVLHAGTQFVPLQVTVPLVGAVQVVHDAPHAATVSLATQVGFVAVPRWQKPGVLQMTRQLSVPGFATLSHAAMPFAGGAGHAVHDVVPHELMLVFATHMPAPAPQRWKPGLQAVVHALLVHTASAFGSAGVAQVTHEADVPHCSVLSLGKQPLVAGQVCVPAPQTSPHAAFTQPWPVGHAVQSRPSRVPHAFDELLPTQIPLQRWNPVSQCWMHAPCALQVTLPLSGASHTVQLLPHELMFVLPLTVQVRLGAVPHWW